MVKINPINKNCNQKTNSKNNTTNSKYKQKFTNKSSNNTNSIERKSVGTEEQATLEKEMFDRSWNVFFRNVDKFPAQRNISAVGAILRPYRETGLDDYKVLGLMKRSGTLLKQNPSSDNINLVNVIYSTAIKCINPDNLINGELKDKNFAKLVDTSIHIYRKYPLGGDIDYRHILGRMVSFKDISERIFSQKHYNMPPELKRVEWSESRQLDFISTIERILQHY
jgi:hypothetical protein